MSRWARATEIPRLVRQLGSKRPARIDAARTRLALIGERAVDALTEALEGDVRQIRAHAMPLLALIHDPRSREPLTAMLLDRDPALREIAVRSLARFPSPETVGAIERMLGKEQVHPVRVAAVHALVELYDTGEERAARKVFEILFDQEHDARLRGAALALLPSLEPGERRRLLRRLKDDENGEVAGRAREYERGAEARDGFEEAAIRSHVRDLRARDYAVWNDAVQRLSRIGAPAIDPLVAEMRRHADDPELCSRAGMALKGLGRRHARGLARALDVTTEPLVLQTLVEVVGALGEKSVVYGLKDLIDRLAARSPAATGFDPMQRVRGKAHLELAKVGSRLAVADLRQSLADPRSRLEPELLAAVELIGKKDELPDLLRMYSREDAFMRERITVAVRTIMRRERIRRNSRMFGTLSVRQRQALEAILPPLRPRGRRASQRGARRR